MGATGVVAVAVAVAVRPLCRFAKEGIVRIGSPIAIIVGASESVNVGGPCGGGAGVRLESGRIIAITVLVAIGGLCRVKGEGIGAV